MAVGAVVVATWLPPTTEMDRLVDRLTWLFQVPIRNYVADNVYVATAIAFYALPALLAMAAGRGLWRRWTLLATAVAVAAVLLVALGELPLPLRPRNTWTLREVGGPRQLISGEWPVMERPWLESLLRGAGIVTMALAIFAVVPRMLGRRVGGQPASTGRLASLARRATAALVDQLRSSRGPLVVYLAAYLVLVNVLWFYNDRYVLVLLPLVVALALGHRDQTVVPRPAWAALALFAVIGVAGTRDSLRFNQAVRDTWQSLVDSGVPPSDIDAGYVWSGWVLYAHPENLAPGLTAADVPWITSRRRPPYILAKGQIEGYDLVREVTWSDDASWPGPDRIYVLKQRAP